MKTFDKKVRWNFSNLGMFGYGRNIKEALLSAAEGLSREVENDLGQSDFLSIETHNLISIDENDVNDEDDEVLDYVIVSDEEE